MVARLTKAETRRCNEAAIAAAAEKVFACDGYRGATTESIARMAGLPKANVHYYFGTKEKLYKHVLQQIVDDWMAAATVFEAGTDPAAALTSYIQAKMRLSRERPFASKVWASEIMRGAPVMKDFLGTSLKRWLSERTAVIDSWIRNGQIRAVDPTALMYLIWSTTQAYADFEAQMRILDGGRRISDARYAAATRDVTRLILGSVGL